MFYTYILYIYSIHILSRRGHLSRPSFMFAIQHSWAHLHAHGDAWGRGVLRPQQIEAPTPTGILPPHGSPAPTLRIGALLPQKSCDPTEDLPRPCESVPRPPGSPAPTPRIGDPTLRKSCPDQTNCLPRSHGSHAPIPRIGAPTPRMFAPAARMDAPTPRKFCPDRAKCSPRPPRKSCPDPTNLVAGSGPTCYLQLATCNL